MYVACDCCSHFECVGNRILIGWMIIWGQIGFFSSINLILTESVAPNFMSNFVSQKKTQTINDNFKHLGNKLFAMQIHLLLIKHNSDLTNPTLGFNAKISLLSYVPLSILTSAPYLLLWNLWTASTVHGFVCALCRIQFSIVWQFPFEYHGVLFYFLFCFVFFQMH